MDGCTLSSAYFWINAVASWTPINFWPAGKRTHRPTQLSTECFSSRPTHLKRQQTIGDEGQPHNINIAPPISSCLADDTPGSPAQRRQNSTPSVLYSGNNGRAHQTFSLTHIYFSTAPSLVFRLSILQVSVSRHKHKRHRFTPFPATHSA